MPSTPVDELDDVFVSAPASNTRSKTKKHNDHPLSVNSDQEYKDANGQSIAPKPTGNELLNQPNNTDIPHNAISLADQQPVLELKLDKIQLTTFDGDYTQWIPFRDQYVDLVHNNPKLTAITKFFQLRSHLRGMASDAINGFKLCSADYETAWFTLKKRYDKPEKIIDEYLQKFYDLPYLTHASSISLLNMVNRTNQLIRVFPALGVDVTSWDTLIKFNLKTRLDRGTYNKWLDQVKFRQNVPVAELLDFIEIEAGEHVPRATERQFRGNVQHRLLPKPQGFRRNPTTMAITSKTEELNHGVTRTHERNTKPTENSSKCAQCKGPHELYLCPTFLGLTVSDRIKKQKAFDLCYRCLRKHKHPADCKFGACPVCQKDHNKLLCYTFERQSKGHNKPKVNNVSSNDDWA